MKPVNQPVILLQDISRRFGALEAVRGLNLEVEKGEICGLVGPDGAGKTTTLRMLTGLLDPTSGVVRVVGFDLAHELERVRDRIGYMAQRFGLYVDLSVGENLDFFADLFGVQQSERKALMDELLEMTRMSPFVDRRAGQLSGGMKQKLGLMCALLHRPEVLLLDEPTNGVDPISRRDFWSILYRLVGRGLTVVVSTSYLDEAERCSRVGLMHQGRMILCETPTRLVSRFRENCYEVRGPGLRRIRSQLERIEGLLAVARAGEALHLMVDDPTAVLPRLRKQLETAGLEGFSIRGIRPSLEDVFLTLTAAEREERL